MQFALQKSHPLQMGVCVVCKEVGKRVVLCRKARRQVREDGGGRHSSPPPAHCSTTAGSRQSIHSTGRPPACPVQSSILPDGGGDGDETCLENSPCKTWNCKSQMSAHAKSPKSQKGEGMHVQVACRDREEGSVGRQAEGTKPASISIMISITHFQRCKDKTGERMKKYRKISNEFTR